MKRANVIFGAGLLLVVTIVALSYLFVVSGQGQKMSPTALSPASPTPVAALRARLLHAEGDVQSRPRDHEWQAAVEGEVLVPGTQLRAGDDAKAEVVIGDDLHINVTAGTDIRLGDVGPDLAHLFVGEGVVLADVRRGRGPRLQIANRNGEAVAETANGALAVSADVNGELRAAVTRGTATVAANGESVNVSAGFFSVAGGGRKPSRPAAVPQSLLLKVRWPGAIVTAQKQQLVTGATTPGARVRVRGRSLWADGKGRFQTIVDLQEGKNRIEIRATDLIGRQTHDESPEIELRTKAPSQVTETSPDMWK